MKKRSPDNKYVAPYSSVAERKDRFRKDLTAAQKAKRALHREVKTAKQIKDSFLQAVGNNVDDLDIWIADLAKENKAQAIQIMVKLTEYILPKLSKEEIILHPKLDYSKLTNEELDILIKLTDKCKI